MLSRARNPITKHVRATRRSLTAIGRELGWLVAVTRAAQRGVPAAQPQKRKLKSSAGRRADLKLQGQSMGNLRNLKPRQKARVKAVREKKGMRAAIAVAKKMSQR